SDELKANSLLLITHYSSLITHHFYGNDAHPTRPPRPVAWERRAALRRPLADALKRTRIQAGRGGGARARRRERERDLFERPSARGADGGGDGARDRSGNQPHERVARAQRRAYAGPDVRGGRRKLPRRVRRSPAPRLRARAPG